MREDASRQWLLAALTRCYDADHSSDTMNLRDAVEKAGQILDEERAYPTVVYEAASASVASPAEVFLILSERGKHPRTIQERPGKLLFKSANFDLLCTLLDQVPEQDRPALLATSLSRISNTGSFRRRTGDVPGAGHSGRCSSELPLVAEFSVRRGDKQPFISALRKAAASPGLTLLLMQLEEMIAIDFTLFTDDEHTQLRTAMDEVNRSIAVLKKRPRPQSALESNTVHYVCLEVPVLCDSISEGCRKATFLYLKGSLLPGMNLEVNQDKGAVRTFLEKLGFTQLLIQSLDEAENLYRAAVTPFDLKSSLGHLRSFLEQLHVQACAAAHKKFGGSLPSRWGEALKYLLDNGVLTKPEELFAAQFYTLMSDTGVHPLIAEHEYARLMRNMSIEYGLLLLTKIDKLGLNQ
jgi:hypothetical protein